jgi:hypothetical protein
MKIFAFFALILFFSESSLALENIAVTTWHEKSFLNNEGKTSEVLIKARIENLEKNYKLTSFGIDFGRQNQILIRAVKFDNNAAKYQFNQGELKVDFPEAKGNDEYFSLYISYAEKYREIHKYLRQEIISIPPFAKGASAKVIIEFPWYLESATLNYNIVKNGNSFIYENKVPASGVAEIIKLTPAQSAWQVLAKTKIKSNKALKGVSVEIPKYFIHPRQKVENSNLHASAYPSKTTKENNRYKLEFDSEATEILMENRANIFVGKAYKTNYFFNTKQYLSYEQEDGELLQNVLYQIKQSKKYSHLPLYAKIGEFVHEFITYKREMVGVRPKIREILANPIGVCTEYATLYNALARIAGIPSIILSGIACGEYQKCEGHVWNMIYYNNQWLEVDPTWNLMSGIVSSSHVFFSNEEDSGVGSLYPGDGRVIEIELDASMKEL